MAELSCPRGIGKRPRELWLHVVKNHPHLTEADVPFLTVYVKLFAQYEVAVDQVSRVGILEKRANGKLSVLAAMQAVSVLTNRLIRMARELGLTVPSRPHAGRAGKLVSPLSTKPRPPRKSEFRVTG